MNYRLAFSSTLALMCLATGAKAADYPSCNELPKYESLVEALKAARLQNNGGLNLDMWGTIVDRSGTVCAVAYTGAMPGSQWPGSRVISAQKAYTANAFSLDGLALSTANLYSAVQPGGSLFGLQESNPVNVAAAYKGVFDDFGKNVDPMVGSVVGGVNVFGGGLALYGVDGRIVGGLGVSGDTSCADHNIAWRTRATLKLDYVTAGVAPTKNDQIIYDVSAGKSPSGYGHPTCGGKEPDVAATLPPTSKVAAPAQK